MERLAGRVMLLWGWRRAATACAAGAFLALAQAPFDFPAAGFVSFTILVWLLDGATGDAARGRLGGWRAFFGTGWWFGFGYFVAGLWWLGNALLVEAENFAWALPFAVFGLPALLALFHGFAAALARLFWTDGLGRIAALAAAFGIIEWLREFVLTGFPWNAIGLAAMPTPVLMQSAVLVGVTGMSAVAVFVFSAPALIADPRPRRAGLAIAAILVALHAGFGFWRTGEAQPVPPERNLKVRLVQPSIDQSSKWDTEERRRIFDVHLDLTRGPGEADERADLVVWPETSVPYLLTERPDALQAIADALDDEQTLLVGAVRAEQGAGQTRYYNSLTMVSGDGEILDAADKAHLVPFGEYLPLEPLLERLGLRRIVATPVSFSASPAPRQLTLPDETRILPLICYEVIFPAEVDAAARGADLIVNVTNDAWYGNTPGPYQHFRQAQIRAVETGLPLVRAANNGISGLVDPYGRIVDALALNGVGTLDGEIAPGAVARPLPLAPGLAGLGVIAAFAALALALQVRQWLGRQ
ncbi:MAG: apolipoprotein N-acyltransferase [Rhizobiaceae bacterium]|nr:apolipoprotein N-acyltransferase [Rhizobiaceae bacterium]MCV0405070.1 apolipoprotein N-acyltransferase [Rhizobiaceae bacterium]